MPVWMPEGRSPASTAWGSTRNSTCPRCSPRWTWMPSNASGVHSTRHSWQTRATSCPLHGFAGKSPVRTGSIRWRGPAWPSASDGRAAEVRTEEPESPEEAAEILLSAGAAGMSVRPRGGGTKFDWGSPVDEPDIVLSTVNLSREVEHNAADLTAVLEAGVPLATAQKVFAESGQMLALDPPLGKADAATIGGIVA